MLAPFFMKAHGYSVAMAGMPLVANGVGRVCSDVMSGIMATYFSPGSLLIAAMIIGLATSIVGYAFIGRHAGFSRRLDCLRPDRSDVRVVAQKNRLRPISRPERQGRVQGQMASALGIGFTLGPLFGGFVGKWLGPDGLIFSLCRAADPSA